jgi:hypothetical protein
VLLAWWLGKSQRPSSALHPRQALNAGNWRPRESLQQHTLACAVGNGDAVKGLRGHSHQPRPWLYLDPSTHVASQTGIPACGLLHDDSPPQISVVEASPAARANPIRPQRPSVTMCSPVQCGAPKDMYGLCTRTTAESGGHVSASDNAPSLCAVLRPSLTPVACTCKRPLGRIEG